MDAFQYIRKNGSKFLDFGGDAQAYAEFEERHGYPPDNMDELDKMDELDDMDDLEEDEPLYDPEGEDDPDELDDWEEY
jgi:hypothetical protein